MYHTIVCTMCIPILGHTSVWPILKPLATHPSFISSGWKKLPRERTGLVFRCPGVISRHTLEEWMTILNPDGMSGYSWADAPVYLGPFLTRFVSQCSRRDGYAFLLLLTPADVVPFLNASVTPWSFKSEFQHQLPGFRLCYIHPC